MWLTGRLRTWKLTLISKSSSSSSAEERLELSLLRTVLAGETPPSLSWSGVNVNGVLIEFSSEEVIQETKHKTIQDYKNICVCYKVCSPMSGKKLTSLSQNVTTLIKLKPLLQTFSTTDSTLIGEIK